MRDSKQLDLFVEAPIWWTGLTGRRRLFVECYCTDRTCFLNATASYIRAYSRPGKELTESSIQSNASRLMRDSQVQTAINKLLRAQQNRDDQLNEFKMLGLLKTLAFYNPNDIIDQYGNLKAKDLSELGELAVCITGIETGRNGKKIKLFDRTKAMELLGRYLDIIRPAEGTIINNPLVAMADKDVDALKDEADAAAMSAVEDAEYQVMNEEREPAPIQEAEA